MNIHEVPTAKPVSSKTVAMRVAAFLRQARTMPRIMAEAARPTTLSGASTRSSVRTSSPLPLAFLAARRRSVMVKSCLPSMGMTDTDTNSDRLTAQVTAMAMSLKSCPASSWMKTTGRNTATVVRVEASTAPQTSLVPSYAARTGPLPSCFRCRSMFSRTTMALSTSMPTAKEMPARETTFRLRPKSFMKMKVPMMEMGMDTATMTVDEKLRRKSSSTMTASAPPMRMFWRTRPMAPLM